jgi:hypothetical protein
MSFDQLASPIGSLGVGQGTRTTRRPWL